MQYYQRSGHARRGYQWAAALQSNLYVLEMKRVKALLSRRGSQKAGISRFIFLSKYCSPLPQRGIVNTDTKQ